MSTKRESIIVQRGYPSTIRGDEVSLYISNYLESAEYLARRIGDPTQTVLELCCGIGVTLEKLADVFKSAIGVELDEQILNWCRDNMAQSKAAKKVRLIHGNVEDINLLKNLKADVVVYDIPYWDMGISKAVYSSEKNPELKVLIKNIRELVTEDIVICAPAHYRYAMAQADLGECEYQEIYRPEHKRTYIYLGRLVKEKGVTRLAI